MKSKMLPVGVILLVAVTAYLWRIRKGRPYEGRFYEVVVEAQAAAAGRSGPHIGNCPIFPADNVWNTPIDTLPKDVRSEAFISKIGPMSKLHPDFGSSLTIGIPYSNIPAGTRSVPVTFEYRDESDLGSYPIPRDAPVENGPNSTGDRHLILIDQARCLLYETFASRSLPDGSWSVGSGIRMDLTSNALRGDGKTSADAAGLPILPGLIRYDEIEDGEITHAIRFTLQRTQAGYVWPARHKASADTSLTTPPMGLRMRLRADFDISKYSRTNQIILTALKRYGIMLADNGSSMFITGVSDKRWDDSDLHLLGNVVADDFEAVDESSLQLLPDSGRVDPTAIKR